MIMDKLFHKEDSFYKDTFLGLETRKGRVFANEDPLLENRNLEILDYDI